MSQSLACAVTLPSTTLPVLNQVTLQVMLSNRIAPLPDARVQVQVPDAFACTSKNVTVMYNATGFPAPSGGMYPYPYKRDYTSPEMPDWTNQGKQYRLCVTDMSNATAPCNYLDEVVPDLVGSFAGVAYRTYDVKFISQTCGASGSATSRVTLNPTCTLVSPPSLMC